MRFYSSFPTQKVLCVGLALCSVAAAARSPWGCGTDHKCRQAVELASDTAVQHIHAPLVQRDAPLLGQTGGDPPGEVEPLRAQFREHPHSRVQRPVSLAAALEQCLGAVRALLPRVETRPQVRQDGLFNAMIGVLPTVYWTPFYRLYIFIRIY